MPWPIDKNIFAISNLLTIIQLNVTVPTLQMSKLRTSNMKFSPLGHTTKYINIEILLHFQRPPWASSSLSLPGSEDEFLVLASFPNLSLTSGDKGFSSPCVRQLLRCNFHRSDGTSHRTISLLSLSQPARDQFQLALGFSLAREKT